jgi:hypothetical protein
VQVAPFVSHSQADDAVLGLAAKVLEQHAAGCCPLGGGFQIA